MELKFWVEMTLSGLESRINTPGYVPTDADYHRFFVLRDCRAMLDGKPKPNNTHPEFIREVLSAWQREQQRTATPETAPGVRVNIVQLGLLLEAFAPVTREVEAQQVEMF